MFVGHALDFVLLLSTTLSRVTITTWFLQVKLEEAEVFANLGLIEHGCGLFMGSMFTERYRDRETLA